MHPLTGKEKDQIPMRRIADVKETVVDPAQFHPTDHDREMLVDREI